MPLYLWWNLIRSHTRKEIWEIQFPVQTAWQWNNPTQRDTAAAAAAKSLQSCPTPCDPIDSSPPGSPVPGILQARTLEWVAISFSNAWKWKVKVKSLSRVQLLVTPWTAAHQASPSMGFSRQKYWSGVPLPSPNKILLYTYSTCPNERSLLISNVGEAVARNWCCVTM